MTGREVIDQSGAENWHISTSLDKRLGEYFRPGSPLEGFMLDVDPDAVQQTIDQLEAPDGGGPHKLRVELAHPDTFKDKQATRESEGYRLLGIFLPLDKDSRPWRA